jgi:hypothetical protein
MQGRALNREPRREWAWLVPWFAGSVAIVVADVTGAQRASFFLTGLAAGVGWQLLYRRDLVSRLTFMAVLMTVAVVGSLVTREDLVWEDMDTTGLLVIGVLLGLIHSEQYLRWRHDAVERSSRTESSREAIV